MTSANIQALKKAAVIRANLGIRAFLGYVLKNGLNMHLALVACACHRANMLEKKGLV